MPLPSPAALAAAHDALDAMEAESRRVYCGLPCWLCAGHLQPCQRADCPKTGAMKDCPELNTEGKASRHDVGGRK